MGCSICTNEDAVLVDRKEKGTYWMCGDCVWEMIEDKRKIEQVVRAAQKLGKKCGPGRSVDESRSWFWDNELLEFFGTIEALPKHLKESER